MNHVGSERKLVTGGDPKELIAVPAASEFAGDDWLDAPRVAEIADLLIEQCECFEQAGLQDARIVYLFKKKGPQKPRRLLGKCQRPSGLLARFSSADFIIWLAANNCRGLTAWQFEALIFHELRHASMGDGKPLLVPHDFEGFGAEIERYGLWKADIERIADAIKVAQRPLPFEPERDARHNRAGVQ